MAPLISLSLPVHYIEAMLYVGINAAYMHRMVLHELRFNIGPILMSKPWYMTYVFHHLYF